MLAAEANGVSDNPLIIADEGDCALGRQLPCPGRWRFAADMMALAICEIGSLAERRIAMLVDPALSRLPAFLTPKPGLNSGFMIPQVTAAALVSENKQRAAPASIDSIPTSANQEDHVSMAAHAARRLLPMAENLAHILGIELLAGCQGCDFHAPLRSSAAIERVRARLRSDVRPSRRRPPSCARHRQGRRPRPLRRHRRRRRHAPPRAAAGIPSPRLRGEGAVGDRHDPHRQRPHHPRARWHRHHGQELAHRSAAAHAHEQPRPRGGREAPELVVYGGIGRAARDWESFDRIVAALRQLEADETLLVQSGKPVGVFRTHADAPRVLIANSNIVPHWATLEHFNELDRKGLMMYGQMTAGSWIYIGSQGIVQGTYETFAEVGRRHYGGSLAGKWILTAGLGGMGGAQPLAAVMAGASMLAVECQPSRIEMRLQDRLPRRAGQDRSTRRWP